jgi:NAD+ synthetase
MANFAKYVEYLEKWLAEQLDYYQADGFVIGISGGVDSAVTAHLLARKYKEKTIGVILPCSSNPQDMKDAQLVIDNTGIESHCIDLTKTHSILMEEVQAFLPDTERRRVVDGNTRARLRMTTLYAVAQSKNYIVVGTDNAAEWYTGYFTKFGDGGVDIVPIIHLNKQEVYEMARYFEVPAPILAKAPSAGLWEDQTDEGEIGTTYEMIAKHLAGEKIPDKDYETIMYWHNRSHHKRELASAPGKKLNDFEI